MSERSGVAEIRMEIEWRMTEGEIWRAWQKYYLSDLYVPSDEPHETLMSTMGAHLDVVRPHRIRRWSGVR